MNDQTWNLHLSGEAMAEARDPGLTQPASPYVSLSPLWSAIWAAVGSNHGGGMGLRLISSWAALQPTEGPLNLSTVAIATVCLLPSPHEIIGELLSWTAL